ncbi:hypothetical protein JB92DRAFT_2832623 [Gautieria morchelliformis]|nr:hypothetical protein JB92DRAFT_2832623 [Gautieria morchelliformis]
MSHFTLTCLAGFALKRNGHPSCEDKKHLADISGLSYHQVKVWQDARSQKRICFLGLVDGPSLQFFLCIGDATRKGRGGDVTSISQIVATSRIGMEWRGGEKYQKLLLVCLTSKLNAMYNIKHLESVTKCEKGNLWGGDSSLMGNMFGNLSLRSLQRDSPTLVASPAIRDSYDVGSLFLKVISTVMVLQKIPQYS